MTLFFWSDGAREEEEAPPLGSRGLREEEGGRATMSGREAPEFVCDGAREEEGAIADMLAGLGRRRGPAAYRWERKAPEVLCGSPREEEGGCRGSRKAQGGGEGLSQPCSEPPDAPRKLDR